MSSRRYNVDEIKDLLTQERNIVQVLEALYNGDATYDRQTNTYRLADIRGGEGKAARSKYQASTQDGLLISTLPEAVKRAA